MKELTAIYWIKNEARYIPEYLEFHLLQGFDHFILYNDGSTDSLIEVCAPYGDLVEIRDMPTHDVGPKNFWVMNRCIEEQRGKSRWIHFHALDERLFCPSGQRVVDFLRDYEEFGGLAVGWILFNSNGHILRPDGLVIDNYTRGLEDDMYHVKTLVQPSKTVGHGGTPHNFVHLPGFCTVDENRRPMSGPVMKPPTPGRFDPTGYPRELIRLHHYQVMSREEYVEKANKGILDRKEAEGVSRGEADWVRYHADTNTYRVETVLGDRYSETIKRNLLNRFSDRPDLLEQICH